jgi:uncharacterized repeat protein (TIGR01451 family)
MLTPPWNWLKQLRRKKRRTARRRLGGERLESRAMLAADSLATITGTAFSDQTDNGLTGDDSLQGGVAVELWRDGGNGTFDNGVGDDVSIGTTSTDGAGVYSFTDLIAGVYFAEQTTPSGFIQKAGENVASVTISSLQAGGVFGTSIDSFNSTDQSALATGSAGNTGSSSIGAFEAIGAERDLFVELTSTATSISLDVAASAQQLLEFSASATATGRRLIVWDGPDGDATAVDPFGLGSIDLTQAGANTGFLFQIGADKSDAQLELTIHTGANSSRATGIALPDTGGAATQLLFLPFSSFTINSGSGATLTAVGALELEILQGSSAVDGQIDFVSMVGPTQLTANFANFEALSLGDLVFNDLNNNGVFDSGTESGISGVGVNLLQDTNGSGDFTPGVDVLVNSALTNGSGNYIFTGLFPGDYLLQIPPSTLTGGLLGFVSSTGNIPTPDPDTNTNNDDDSDDFVGQGVVTGVITLAANQEPINDGDSDPDTNLSLDVGIFAATDLQITKADSVDPVVAGNPLTYTLTVTNNGPAPATGVTVTDMLPAGITFQSATPSQGTATETAGVVTAPLGNLASGATATVSIVVAVGSSTTTALSNSATVTGNELDLVPGNNSATEPTTLNTEIDLQITKADSVDPAVAGQALTYTLIVLNNGPSDATGVIVTDSLPAGITFGSVTPSQGTAAEAAGVVTATVGTLASGATATVTIVVNVPASAAGTLSNTAQVTANETETNAANNSDTETTALISQVDVAITKTDTVDPVTAGENLTYTLVVTNNGPSNATNVVVTDTLPTQFSFATGAATQGTVTQAAGVATATIGSLTPGQSETITITGSVASSTLTALSNVASVTSTQTDTVPGNNTVTEPTAVVGVTDLRISKTESIDPVLAGDSLTYSITVNNDGPSDATLVSVVDALPANVSFVSATSSQGSVVNAAGTVTASLGTIVTGGSATVSIVTDVLPNFLGTLTNTATVTGNQTDPTPGNNSATVNTTSNILPSSIAGVVYVDLDNDGVQDPTESPIPNVTVTLTGTDVVGNPVNVVQTTNAAGAYLFSNLVAGTYQLAETQPAVFPDGIDTAGNAATSNTQNDVFDTIVLNAGADATAFNFGEMPPAFSKRQFLASS